ncbi:MAG: anthranilate phosphoribosyltransferase [Rhodospirillales bacterium]
MTDLKKFIKIVADGNALNIQDAEEAFKIIMSGNATPTQIGGFLMALRVRGETVDELTGAARAMRERALRIEAPKNAMDIVGTGGDGTGTLNISTGASIVAAACGIPIAKHGNRALSSKSGAADVLSALGVNTDADFSIIKKAIWNCNIGFLMATRHHSAMRHVSGPRVELAVRTLFNLLGPISNPAGVKRQLTGVFDKKWITPMAQTLHQLGTKKAWIMHGSDGSDELTTTGITYVSELNSGKITEFEVHPSDANIPTAKIEDLKGRDPKYNAQAIIEMLNGSTSAYRNIVILNASAALIVAGKVKTLQEGKELATQAIDSGEANRVLSRLITITNQDTIGENI